MSTWEIATKGRIGKLAGVERLLSNFDELMDADRFVRLPITHRHALLAGRLQLEHRDPFDRTLASQAMGRKRTLITNDSALGAFGVATLW